MQSYRTAATRLRHPVNIALHTNAPLGVRVANADPYPFIFLNLAFGTQAAYAAPLILLASNQSAVRDRATLEHAALEAEEADQKDDDLRARLERIEAMLTALSGTKS